MNNSKGEKDVADRTWLRDNCTSGSLLWKCESNAFGSYSIIDGFGRTIACVLDGTDAEMISEDHNDILELENEIDTLHVAMSEDQEETAARINDMKTALTEAKDLANQILLECSKFSNNAPKLHQSTMKLLTKVSGRKV